ncbi:hypothetical protein [Chromobacterium piscinae]|uniref:hypothetical protein n=1 Tax=Chromobacterium piscinae TaxID=686831 RepID=UPI00320B0748
MIELPEACVESDDFRASLVVKDPPSKGKLVVSNPDGKRLVYIKVDGYLFDGRQKCDRLVHVHGNNVEKDRVEHAIFVELKGMRVNDGLEQLKETLNHTSTWYERSVKKSCYLLTTKAPKLDGTGQRLKRMLEEKMRVDLKIKNLQWSIDV